MANNFNYQVISDNNKKIILYLTGELDANGEIANTKVIGSALPGALSVDANNNVLVANGGTPRSTYRYTVARIAHNVNIPSGYLRMYWEGTGTNSTLYDASGNFDFNAYNNIGVIPNSANSPTGNIIFSTVNASSNCSYSIFLEIHKNNLDYNAGQILRPNDFNFGGVRP